MAVYKRWVLSDANGSYTFRPNPNAMTTPFPERSIGYKVTTAIDGQTLLFEGNRTPAQWQFSGEILDHDQYEYLRQWVYDRTGRRVVVTDHFGRRIVCVLTKFDAVPKRAIGRYWRHQYTISAIVISIGAPTVNEVPA